MKWPEARCPFSIAAALVISLLLPVWSFADSLGSWDPPFDLGLEGIHAIHLPTGKILYWGENHDGTDGYVTGIETRLYDPVTGQITVIQTDSALFCSGFAALEDGRVVVVGGNGPGASQTTIFDPITETWTRVRDITVKRYYPTLITLPDGRVLALGGARLDDSPANVPEVYDAANDAWLPLPGATRALRLYPRAFVGPDGRIYYVGALKMPAVLDVATETWADLPPEPLAGGPAVMYRPGKILKSGSDEKTAPFATNGAAVIDLNEPSPAFRPTAPMNFARFLNQLTVLPDGKVLTTGGGGSTNASVLAAEIWDPDTETWTTLASMQQFRRYHSTAILLRDGRVLMTGSEPDVLVGEIFNPPYLFNGPRPSVSAVTTSAAGNVEHGETFEIVTPDAGSIRGVSLIRLGAVTHSFDQGQRFMWLPFTAGADRLTVVAPPDANAAPPGYYMLFLVANSGVPSIAEYLRVVHPPRQNAVLTVMKTGPGSGLVKSTPPGINCGLICRATYDLGAVVTLNPIPAVGSSFGGWSGGADCLGGVVTMTADTTCTAIFNAASDLRISALTAPATTGAGLSINVSDTTQNQGLGAADASATGFYLSATGAVPGARFLGSRPIGHLDPGQTSTAQTALTIPGDVVTGTYYVVAVADVGNELTEKTESNNAKQRSIKIGPDLIVSAISAPLSAAAGATISVNVTTRNIGGGAAGPSTTKIYLTTSTVLHETDVPVAVRNVPALGVNGSDLGPVSVTVPVAGVYYFIGVADAQGAVDETTETNNLLLRQKSMTVP